MATARRRLWRCELVAAARRGVVPAGWGIAVGGGAVAVGAAFGSGDPRGAALGAAGALLVVVGALWPAWCALRRYRLGPPSWRRCAERLDLAAGTRNRIATALTLLTERRTAFGEAAVAQGVQALREAADVAPWHGREAVDLRRLYGPLTSLVVLCGVALVVRVGSVEPTLGETDRRAAGPPDVPRAAVHVADAPEPDGSADRPASRGRNASPREVARAAGAAAPERDVAAAASAGAGGSAGSPRRAEAARADGGAEAGYAAAEQAAERGRASRDSGSAARVSPGRAGAAESAAARAAQAIAPGAAAVGEARAVASSAGVGDAALDDAGRADDADARESGTATEYAQRGGARVMLPDRRQAPSRELGISGPTGGRPGTGRGGPSPVKKSRGTGALVMGIPVPDFLRGQLNSGPTAVRHEQTWPEAAGETPAAGPVLPTQDVVEGPVRPFVVPWNEAGIVRRYLEQWHGPAAETFGPDSTEHADDRPNSDREQS